MSETRSIKCDNCDDERVVDSSYPSHFTLQLKCIDTGINTSGMVYGVMQYPPLKDTKHFCGYSCLVEWLGKEIK